MKLMKFQHYLFSTTDTSANDSPKPHVLVKQVKPQESKENKKSQNKENEDLSFFSQYLQQKRNKSQYGDGGSKRLLFMPRKF